MASHEKIVFCCFAGHGKINYLFGTHSVGYPMSKVSPRKG